MLTAIRRLLGAGTRLPDEVRAQLDAEGILYLADHVPVVVRFSGSVPGLHSSTSIFRSAGALAFTSQRALATMATRSDPAQHLLDCRWDATTTGPLKAEISSGGVQLDLDIRRVDTRFNGHLSLHYKTKISDGTLALLPRTSLALGITAADVSRILGVRPTT